MRGFSVKNFLPNGDLRSEVFGKEGRHYPDTDTLEVDQVRWRSISPEGLVTHGSADRGVSNGDGTEIQLFGNAIVIRDAAKSRQTARRCRGSSSAASSCMPSSTPSG